MKRQAKAPDTKWLACRESKIRGGGIYGYIETFRCAAAPNGYVTVPGASRWMELDGTIRQIS
jgi:hypothetical protein